MGDIAEVLNTIKDELLVIWLADQVKSVVDDEQKIANKALYIAKNKRFCYGL